MTKFKNKYRVESHRRPNWDYSANALYFLTIVNQNRVCNLGKIENNEMILSDFGNIVETEWHKSFDIRKELFLDEFIIMPNHLHAIVEIDNPVDTDSHPYQQPPPQLPPPQLSPSDVDTDGRPYLRIKRNPPIRLPKSISSFIAGFKSAVNTKIDDYIDEQRRYGRPSVLTKYNRNNHFFQPNYHDHIIRNEGEYQRIKNYIINNPANWEKDKLHS